MQKKIKIGIIFYLCTMCFTANAQKEEKEESAEKKNIVKINLLHWLLKIFLLNMKDR